MASGDFTKVGSMIGSPDQAHNEHARTDSGSCSPYMSRQSTDCNQYTNSRAAQQTPVDQQSIEPSQKCSCCTKVLIILAVVVFILAGILLIFCMKELFLGIAALVIGVMLIFGWLYCAYRQRVAKNIAEADSLKQEQLAQQSNQQQLMRNTEAVSKLVSDDQMLNEKVAQIPQLQQQLSAVNDKNEKMEQQLSAVNDKSKQIERNLSNLQTDITALQQFMQQQTNATSTQKSDS